MLNGGLWFVTYGGKGRVLNLKMHYLWWRQSNRMTTRTSRDLLCQKPVNHGIEFEIYSKCSGEAMKKFKQRFSFDWHQHHMVKCVKIYRCLICMKWPEKANPQRENQCCSAISDCQGLEGLENGEWLLNRHRVSFFLFIEIPLIYMFCQFLLYNKVIVIYISVCMYMYILFHIFFHYGLLQEIEYSAIQQDLVLYPSYI